MNIRKRLDRAIRIDLAMSKWADKMIAAERGNEKPSETLLKEDSLSLQYRRLCQKRKELELGSR